jgi:beta-N-acetylhexosaminidase
MSFERSGYLLVACAGSLAIMLPGLTQGATAPATAAAASGGGSSLVAHALPVAAACTNAQQVASWSLRRLAHQTVTVPVQETNVAAASPEVHAGAGGVILFGDRAPAELGSALRTLTSQALGGVPPLVMTDEEGGAVQRMANLVGSMPSARTMAATMTPRQVRRLATRVGARMRNAHVTMDLAPVLDLDGGAGPNTTDAIGTRSFSLDPRVTTRYGLAFARGMLTADVIPVVKHFPGLGQATANTDLEPASTRPWSDLQRRGLEPFLAAIDAGMPAVMVTNARVPGLTTLPATLSSEVNRKVLRQRMGFHGLVLTDSLSAGAVRRAGYHIPAASVRALRVGADMVLFSGATAEVPDVTRRIVRAMVNAVRAGHLPRSRLHNAVLHVLRAKHLELCR